MFKRLLAALAACLTVGVAHAADPTMSVITSTVNPLTFEEYAGTKPVGDGQVNTDIVYFIDEQTGTLGKSWYIFYEPRRSESFSATFTFDSDIVGIFYTTADLDASNAEYGAPGITYKHATLTGLESSDSFSILGNVLTLSIRAQTPGDHVRIFTSTATAVPEPATYVLLTVSLLAVGFVARRRKR